MGTSVDYTPFGNMESRNGLQATFAVPLLIRALGLPTGGRVLEVGCGRGIALPVLSRLLRPSKLVGLDNDDTLLGEARRRVDGGGLEVTLIYGDVRQMPFPDDSFDLVIDFGTCYHIARPAVALQEVERVLAPGGLFVHETRIAQHLAHPVRSFGRRLPWRMVPMLQTRRRAILWDARQAVG